MDHLGATNPEQFEYLGGDDILELAAEGARAAAWRSRRATAAEAIDIAAGAG